MRSPQLISVLKFAAAALLTGALLAGLGSVYLEAFAVQSVYFAALVLLLTLKRSLAQAMAEIRLFLPFVGMMLAIYALFGLLQIQHDAASGSPLRFWLMYGANRVICFINTVISLSLIVAWFRIDDVLALPIPVAYLKALILGESLFQKAHGALADIDLYLRHFPDQRLLPARWHSRLFMAFQRQLLVMLTLIFYVLEEAEIQGELIDNRMTHCVKKSGS